MKASMTRSEFVRFLKSLEGKAIDFDGWYGQQCYDLANYGFNKLFPGYSLGGESACNIPWDNKAMLKDKARVVENTLSYIPKPGTMVIFNNSYGGGYGHVSWVLSANQNQIIVIENNWLGGGWTWGDAQGGGGWEKATVRAHGYDFPMWFIEPNFKDEVQTTWNWGGKFTADRTIKVRRTPGLRGSIVGAESFIYSGQYVNFDQVIKADGYWWIRFKYPTNPSAGNFYMAVCKITDKWERMLKEKYWGRINWK
ncbi:lysin [Staphylococcus phage SAP6]|nr:lysin [Staphylococcus phage StAP1]WAW12126.1 lysin [Staphylococcus phage SAP6]